MEAVYGRSYVPATISRHVAAVTGALMMLDRKAFDSVGGFGAEFVVGDYEDSDLCFKIQASGGLCYYDADVEFFHFEGQSYSSPERESGATIYNRQLHHEKWAPTNCHADVSTRVPARR